MIGMKKLMALDFGETKGKGCRGLISGDCVCLSITGSGGECAFYCLSLTDFSYYSVQDGKRCGRGLFDIVRRGCYSYTASSLSGIGSAWPFTDLGEVKKTLIEAVNQKGISGLDMRTGFYTAVMEAECLGRKNRLERAKAERARKEKDLNASVSGVPEGFTKWIHSRTPAFFLTDGETGTMVCTKCGASLPEKAVKNNAVVFCPRCGEKAKVRKIGDPEKNFMKTEMKVTIFSPEKGFASVRYFEVTVVSSLDGEQAELTEKKRVFYKNGKGKALYLQKNGSFSGPNVQCIRESDSLIYPGEELREACEEGGFSACYRTLRACADAGCRVPVGDLMIPRTERELFMCEMLVKGRFYELFSSAIKRLPYRFLSNFPHRESELKMPGVLGLERPYADFLRNENGGIDMLRWLRVFCEEGLKPEKEPLKWLLKEKLSPQDFRKRPEQMSLRQSINYLRRQTEAGKDAESLPASEVLAEWYDYLSMCEKEKKDLTDEMIYRPKDLKLRHDRLVEEIRERRLRELEAGNREAAEKRREELSERYPRAMENVNAVRERFEFSDEEFTVLMPGSLTDIEFEGLMLHHCVGASSLYYERMERNETYICFLRKNACPDLPYYTIEVEPGGNVRQSRSEYDKEPDIEHVRKFIRKWQRFIRSKMTEEDRTAAERSAELGRMNIADRLARFGENDRVYRALMEDFLLAAEDEKEAG